MDRKIIIVAAFAVAAVVIGAAAVVVLNDDGEETKYKVLIEDQKGFYFWTEGSGSNYYEVLSNASPGVEVTIVDASWGKYVSAINGLKAGDSSYWSAYYYADGAWNYSDSGVAEMETSEYTAIALFYVETDPVEYTVIAGGPDHLKNIPSPDDAKVWNGSGKGMIFGLQSETGLYFYVNGEGKTAFDAFSDAAADYSIPFEPSDSSYGKGINSIFGIKSRDTGVIDPDSGYSIWLYWAQFYANNGSNWEYGMKSMSNTDTDEFDQCAIIFSTGGMGSVEEGTIPVYA